MKNLMLIITALLVTMVITAQTNSEETDLVQSIYGIDKKAIVNVFVQPKNINATVFWGVYEEYEVERKLLGKERILLLDQFTNQYDKMTNKESSIWMKHVFALDNKQDKLLKSYYKKVSKNTSPLVAMRFYQVEYFLLTVMRYEILNEMPFIEDK